MARAALNVLTLLLLLLFLAGVALWVRSHRQFEVVIRHGEPEYLMRDGHAYSWRFASAFGRFAVVETLEYQPSGEFPAKFAEPGWCHRRKKPAAPTHDHAAYYNWPSPVRRMITESTLRDWLYPQYFQYPNFIHHGQGRYQFIRGVSLPYWPLVLLFSIVPLTRFIGWFRGRRRRSRGLCSRCAYDLRASAVRCPECGEPIPSA